MSFLKPIAPYTIGICVVISQSYASMHAGSVYDSYDENADTVHAAKAHQQPSFEGETVADAITIAISRNPQIPLAIAQRDAVKAEKFRAIGQFLPSVEGTGSYAHEDFRSASLDTLNERDGVTMGVSFRQPVFRGFTTLYGFREQNARLRSSEYSVLDSQSRVALLAARAHASVTLANDIVGHRIDNLALVQSQLEITQMRMDAGAQSRTGVEQARMRAAQAKVALEEARANESASSAFYESVVGHAPPRLTPDIGAINSKNAQSLDEAVSFAVNNNPSLNAARENVIAARFSKRAAYGKFSPNLNIEGNFLRRFEEGIGGTDSDEYQIVARLRIPFFAQGGNIADLKSASSQSARRVAQRNATQLSVVEIVSRSWGELNAAIRRRDAAIKAVEAAELSVYGLKLEFDAGRRTVIDVLDGQRDLVDTKISLSRADFDIRIARYELAAALGQIVQIATDAGVE